MSVASIVHISPTPLVGAPGKIAAVQNTAGHDAIAIALNDYPAKSSLEKIFLENTLLVDEFNEKSIESIIRSANIIHVHNYLPDDRADWLINLNQSANYVFQSHSPLREGPLYWDRSKSCISIEFKIKMVVGQYLGRMYPSFIPVPNFILFPASIKLRQSDEKLRVLFSPTHKHQGRWNSKYSENIEQTLNALEKLGKIELIVPKKSVSPVSLMTVRRNCHVSIDEIATGGFHMVSLEGLCSGNVVINRADFFSKATYAGFCDGVMPPFQYADDSCIGEVLMMLANDWELTNKIQKESYDYFVRYCNPQRLLKVFNAAYETI